MWLLLYRNEDGEVEVHCFATKAEATKFFTEELNSWEQCYNSQNIYAITSKEDCIKNGFIDVYWNSNEKIITFLAMAIQKAEPGKCFTIEPDMDMLLGEI